jgi:hypothetical protein
VGPEAGAPDANPADAQPPTEAGNPQDAAGDAQDATGNPPSDAALPPTGDAAADPNALCPDIATVANLCYPSACAQAIDAECTAVVAPAFSTAYAQALHSCASKVACVDALDPSSSCMAPLVRAAAPTGAQMTLASAFCQACAKAPATTDGGLSCVGHVLSPGSTGRMLPTSLLSLSDAYAEKVYSAGCIQQGVQQYPNDYDNCESVFLNCVSDTLPEPSACSADAGSE